VDHDVIQALGNPVMVFGKAQDHFC
jgi:hypothetical protein